MLPLAQLALYRCPLWHRLKKALYSDDKLDFLFVFMLFFSNNTKLDFCFVFLSSTIQKYREIDFSHCNSLFYVN